MDYFVLRFDHSYRKEDFRALSKLAGKTTRKWSSRIISVFGFAVGLFAFLSGILMLWSDREISDLTATLLLFGGLCLVLGFFRNRLNAWGARKQSLQVENLTMKFSDEGWRRAAARPRHRCRIMRSSACITIGTAISSLWTSCTPISCRRIALWSATVRISARSSRPRPAKRWNISERKSKR